MGVFKELLQEEGYFNEVYFGKTKQLLEAEKQLAKLRDANMNPGNSFANSSPDMLKFNRLMENAFGFENFSLVLQYTPGGYNMSTIPICQIIDAPNTMKMLSANKKTGFSYEKAKGSSVVVFIDDGLWCNTEITNGEIMGLILHEVGHNFQAAISPYSAGISFMARAMNLIMLPLTFLLGSGQYMFKGTRKWWIECYEYLRREQSSLVVMCDAMAYLTKIALTILAIPSTLASMVQRLMGGPAIPVPSYSNLMVLLKGPAFFKDETLSDNFATIYGYGPELQSALQKMKYDSGGRMDDKILKSIPFIAQWVDFCDLPCTITIDIIGCHPNDAFRCQDQINLLKKELEKSGIDPKMKAKIRRDIADIEKQLDKCLDMTKQGFEFTNMWSAFLLTIFGGDIRACFASNNAELFDRAFEANLTKVKKEKYGR